MQHLQSLVRAAQARLAEVEAAFSVEKRKVDALLGKALREASRAL